MFITQLSWTHYFFFIINEFICKKTQPCPRKTQPGITKKKEKKLAILIIKYKSKLKKKKIKKKKWHRDRSHKIANTYPQTYLGYEDLVVDGGRLSFFQAADID